MVFFFIRLTIVPAHFICPKKARFGQQVTNKKKGKKKKLGSICSDLACFSLAKSTEQVDEIILFQHEV
jgi:hypothetical protein